MWRKAYSLMDWLILFSVLLAALAITGTAVKRTVAVKAKNVGDFMLWQSWGDHAPEQVVNDGTSENAQRIKDFNPDLNFQAKTTSAQSQAQQTLETHDRAIQYATISNHATRSVTVSVPDEQQYLLNKKSVDNLKVDTSSVTKD